MNAIRDKDKMIIQKEQELTKLMQEYYNFDMTELKQEISKILNSETEKINKDKDNKLKEISNSFKRIMGLAKDHIARGSQYKVNELDEQRAIDEFERQSEEYEKIVKDANQ